MVVAFGTGSAQKPIDEIMGPVGVDPLDVAALSAPRLHGHPNPLLDSNAFGSNMVLAADDCVLFGVRRPTVVPTVPLGFSQSSCLISCVADIACLECGARRSGCALTLPHCTARGHTHIRTMFGMIRIHLVCEQELCPHILTRPLDPSTPSLVLGTRLLLRAEPQCRWLS